MTTTIAGGPGDNRPDSQDNKGQPRKSFGTGPVKHRFILACVVGILVTVITPFNVHENVRVSGQEVALSPLIVVLTLVFIMVCYLVSLVRNITNLQDRHEMADTIYYLGFIYTLINLTVAIGLDFFGLNWSEGEFDPLHSFATAMITTIFGLISRIAIVNSDSLQQRRQERDGIDALNDDLIKLRTQLSLSEKRLSDASNKISKSLEDSAQSISADAIGDSIARLNRDISEAGQKLVNSTANWEEQVNESLRSVGQVLSPLQQLEHSLQKLSTSLESMGDVKFEGFEAHFETLGALTENMREALSLLAADVSSFGRSLQAGSQVLDRTLQNGEEQWASHLRSLSSRMESEITTWPSMLDSISKEVETSSADLSLSLREIVENLKQISEPPEIDWGAWQSALQTGPNLIAEQSRANAELLVEHQRRLQDYHEKMNQEVMAARDSTLSLLSCLESGVKALRQQI